MMNLFCSKPGIDGIEACRAIRRLAPKTGIVMITVRDTENDKVSALAAGADDFVTKPFRLRELVSRLRAVLGRIHPEMIGSNSSKANRSTARLRSVESTVWQEDSSRI
jgi:DNA-binding response OmpR family regulator